MFTLRSTLQISLLGALSFALGYWIAVTAVRSEEVSAFEMERADAAIRAAMQSTSELEQAELLLPLLRGMQAGDAPRLAETFESSLQVGGREPPAALFIERWAQLDPEAAWARVQDWPADRIRAVLPGLLRAWAASDPSAALEALESISDSGVRSLAQTALIEGWADSGDPGAWAFATAIDDDVRRNEASNVVMRQVLVQEGVEGLIERVRALPDAAPYAAHRAELMSAAANMVARIDLDAAIAFATEEMESEGGARAVISVAAHWATLDSRASMAWLRGLPPGDARDNATFRIYQQWLRRDRGAAEAWLDEAGEVPDLLPAYRARATVVARIDPSSAATWSAGIRDADLQRAVRLQIGRIWLRKDRPEATRWLAEVGLDELSTPTMTPAAE
jgi:hypothetical protein